jgi:hypothetical protein
MKMTKKYLDRIVREILELDIEVGDVILTGKFKNKRKVVKDFGKDDLGQPTINGTKALNFRIEKLMPKEKWSKKSKEALEFAEKVEESSMRITKRQLRRIVKEEMNRLSEVADFASLTGPDSPLVVSSYMKTMSRARTSSKTLGDLAALWDAMLEAPGDVANARTAADSLGLASALASFHARKLKEGEVYPTGDELRAAIEALGPPKPRTYSPPRKPYGGGSRQRPWDQST